MFRGDRLADLMHEARVTKTKFAEIINISKVGLDGIISGDNPGVKRLEMVADYFKVPMDYFFDREVDLSDHGCGSQNIGHSIDGNGNTVNGDISLAECTRELQHLRELLEEKERVVEEKERIIQILMNKR